MENKWAIIAIAAMSIAAAIAMSFISYSENIANAEAARAGLVQKYVEGHNEPIWVRPDK